MHGVHLQPLVDFLTCSLLCKEILCQERGSLVVGVLQKLIRREIVTLTQQP